MKDLKLWMNPSRQATLLGLLVAICSAWATIDWITFDLAKAWPSLVTSAIIALGGYVSQIKTRKKKAPVDCGNTQL